MYMCVFIPPPCLRVQRPVTVVVWLWRCPRKSRPHAEWVEKRVEGECKKLLPFFFYLIFSSSLMLTDYC